MYMKLFSGAPGYLAIIKIQSSLINFSFEHSTFLLLHREWEEISRVDCQVLKGPFPSYPQCLIAVCSCISLRCILQKLCSHSHCTFTVYFQSLCFYFLSFQSLVFPLPGTEQLFHFNASNIIKETDDREYKNDGKCYKSEISTTKF